MKITTEMFYTTKVMDAATGKPVKVNPRRKNLILDQGLNMLARRSITNLNAASPAAAFQNAQIGSGTRPTTVASGAVTFTQSGTTLTASSAFFTNVNGASTIDMVGCLFKFGTGSGGQEIYITAFGSSTSVTVSVSQTVSTPTVGTVYAVNQTQLQTFLYAAQSYQTGTGDCGTTFASNQVTHKRTLVFAQQASTYNVNEIGWHGQSLAAVTAPIAGRAVLASTDVVAPSNFYVIVFELVVTYTPGSPTAVGNVGTNIDTAGNLMIEKWNIQVVQSNGITSTAASSTNLDGSSSMQMLFATATYTQNSSINTSTGVAITSPIAISGNATFTYLASSIGICQATFNGTASTTGQTLYGMGTKDGGNNFMFDLKFTTPQTAPTGTFQPITVWQLQYTRNLVN